MSHLRRFWRILKFLLWMWPFALRARVLGLGGREGIRRVTYCTRNWGRFLIKNFGVKVDFVCDHEIPDGVLIVSNHQSYIDILAHASLFLIRFAPKVEIKRWPVLGWYLGTCLPVWVDRKSRQKSKAVMEEFRRTLSEGMSLVVYPEGTTTDGMHGILPFKSTPFETVIGTEFMIQPLITEYTIGEDGWNPAWYGDQTLLPHVWRFSGRRELKVKVTALPLMQALPDEDRKQLAERVEAAMRQAMMKK